MVTTSKAPAPAQDAGGGSPSLASIVPACPQGVAITKADFLKPDFSVDNFFIEVSVREGGASLDTLRDELGMYLKVVCRDLVLQEIALQPSAIGRNCQILTEIRRNFSILLCFIHILLEP